MIKGHEIDKKNDNKVAINIPTYSSVNLKGTENTEDSGSYDYYSDSYYDETDSDYDENDSDYEYINVTEYEESDSNEDDNNKNKLG